MRAMSTLLATACLAVCCRLSTALLILVQRHFAAATLYTSDLSLSNGIGDWTIVEGEDDLFLYNNKRGKTYKFAPIEVDQAPPKR